MKQAVINFLLGNIAWIIPLAISGILVPFVIHFLQKKKKGTQISLSQNIDGKNVTSYQGQSIVVHRTGMNVADVKEIANSVFIENFPKLQALAKTEAVNNVKLFIDELDKKINSRLNQDEINKFCDPDIQYALYEAIKNTARKNNEELRKNLAALVVDRVKNDDKDLKRIVYNEAISTIGKLTPNQLKILTICFLLHYSTNEGVIDWVTFNKYLIIYIAPFINFVNNHSDFQHIGYTGCGASGIGESNIIEIFKNQYTILFRNPIEKSLIDNLNLPETIIQEIIEVNLSEGKYYFRFRNKHALEQYSKEKSIEDNLKTKLLSIYNSHIKSNKEIEEMIKKETIVGEKLIKLWKEQNIAQLSLTSVGIVIAAVHLEQTVGVKINIDIWIK